jgi:hypothetical protein
MPYSTAILDFFSVYSAARKQVRSTRKHALRSHKLCADRRHCLLMVVFERT